LSQSSSPTSSKTTHCFCGSSRLTWPKLDARAYGPRYGPGRRSSMANDGVCDGSDLQHLLLDADKVEAQLLAASCRCTRLRRAAARCGQTQTARSRAPAPPDNEKWSASSRWRMAWHRWCASSPTWGSSAKSTPTRAPQPLGPWFKWSARSQRPHLDPGSGGVCRQGLDILLPRLPHGAVGRRAARSQRDRHPE